MKYFLGVDGGGTRTRAVVIDDTGRVGGRGESGPGNLHHTPESTVLHHLAEAITAALRGAGASPEGVVSAFLGMAGVTSDPTVRAFERLARAAGLGEARIQVDHDIRIALAGGLAGRPGIALIVGTGSSCYGRTDDGRHWQTGGWGSLVADEGSGYDLGRRAMMTAVRMADGRESSTALREEVFRWLGVSGVREILARLYERGLERDEIATFAPRVVELATGGDPGAWRLLESGAAELGAMVAANHRHLPTRSAPEVVVTGGLGVAPTIYRELIRKAIVARLPEAQLMEPEFEPAVGAALLAFTGWGGGLSPGFLARIREGQQ